MLELIKKYLPTFFIFIANEQKIEKRLAKFELRYESLRSSLVRHGDSVMKPHSIYEWIVDAELGNQHCIEFLRYLDEQLAFCIREIDENLKPKLRSIAFNVIGSFDTDVDLKDNPRYLTFLGELLTVHRILSLKARFELLDIEVELPNGRRSDIFIRDRENGSKVLFDIYSIIGFNPLKPTDENDLINFFHGRYEQKLKSKLEGLSSLTSGSLTVEVAGEQIPFAILPILWNEIFDLRSWKDILKLERMQHAGVLPLSILIAQQDSNGGRSFIFSTVQLAVDMI